MEVLFERVAGLDIGKESLTVCMRIPGPGGRRVSETRTVKTTTRALGVMRNWLDEHGVTIAAMESTSTYWKAPFYCLEEVMEVWLLNAAHMKAVPGRKTDVKDAEWIAQLLEHGLLRPSFVPPPGIRRLRMLTRYREQLMGDRTREATRLELMLEDASIKLSSVASSLTTVSARAMLAALIEGERDPRALAQLAKGRMRVKIPELTEALTGHFDANHARLARAILDRLDRVEAALAELDAVLEDAFAPWDRQLQLLQTIPGVGPRVAQVIIAETGADMSRFPSAAHLAAWAGVAPGVYESAGKRSPAGARHGNKWLNHMLVEAAGSVARMKGTNYLSAQHARLTARRGMGRAQVAVAHSILVSAYYMLRDDEPYRELGADWLARRNDEAHTRRLVAQLERLGHTVVLDPVA
ncbi:Transposase [Geodermatophilus africanus]|uniref:Transposase n=3 Tax=Geodermatophilus africanus TaxID=1137993 RepID=A0A1H3QKH5_9ACTN|nr:IS110 family transposase [Geodermatophilus africanus]SDZ14094.1 Transposase [Geodermatophilus africanus]SDZ19100.1 Transposase [Geodermatophilus africanus]